MPGFIVNEVGKDGTGSRATEGIKPYYNYTWEIESLFEDPQNTAKILAKEASLPTFTVNKENVEGSSLIYKFAGMVQWDDIKITFYDIAISDSPGSQQFKTIKAVKKWRESVWDHKVGLKAPDKYKKDSIIKTYTHDWSISSAWTLHGSWPSMIKDGDLTYTSTDVKVIDVTISYDWATNDEYESEKPWGTIY